MNEYNYITSKEAQKMCGVTNRTLFNWYKQGKVHTNRTASGYKVFYKPDLLNIVGYHPHPKEERKKYCYCRVSSKHQMDDLERQVEFFRTQYPGYSIIKDCGSGINWKRKGLQTILEQSMLGDVQEVVVAHRDRLCRFAFELIEFILERNNVKLVVLDKDTGKSRESELADDILSIVQIFACRRNGKRRYNKPKGQETKDIPNKETETPTNPMDGSV